MRNTRSTSVERTHKGLTLIETMVAVAVLGILASIAVNAYATYLQNERLKGLSDGYRTDFQWARSLATQFNQTVFFQFGQFDGGNCYMVYTGSLNACKCEQTPDVCTAGGQSHRVVQIAGNEGLSIGPTGTQKVVTIEPVRGVITPTLTVEARASTGQAIRHITNITGRTRVCTPGEPNFGYGSC